MRLAEGAGPGRRQRGGADLLLLLAPPERVDDLPQAAGVGRRAGTAVAAGGAVELGVELHEKPVGALHLRLVGGLHERGGAGDAAPALLPRQAPRQLGGDGRGAVEQADGGGRVLPPDRVGQPSEQLVQVLAQGAPVTPEGLLLQLVVGDLAPAPLSADQRLQAPGAGRRRPSGDVGVPAAGLTGGDGPAG
jgi:hypothetical protein